MEKSVLISRCLKRSEIGSKRIQAFWKSLDPIKMLSSIPQVIVTGVSHTLELHKEGCKTPPINPECTMKASRRQVK